MVHDKRCKASDEGEGKDSMGLLRALRPISPVFLPFLPEEILSEAKLGLDCYFLIWLLYVVGNGLAAKIYLTMSLERCREISRSFEWR